ncbi:hypothetical protein [Kitasatospora sp. NPDC088134]|uniref:hypothetical protein n=1 Tax=Kitasatospora sp. NPDC088134 TaxID=3364071 RepID=UPI0038032410
MTTDPLNEDLDLHQYAKDFATELTGTLQGVLPVTPSFHAVHQGKRIWVTTVADSGDGLPTQRKIDLLINGKAEMSMTVEYFCCWDQAGQFLAVDNSAVKIYCRGQQEPLFRYEYVRKHGTWPPAAHIQLHAHRDEIAWIQRLAAHGKPAVMTKKDSVPRLSQIHFPVGGHRMRPGLEDVLLMIVREFGIDTVDGWEDALLAGIQLWRHKQVRAAVRDAPDEAADVLRQLGYEVTAPTGTSPGSAPPKLYLP